MLLHISKNHNTASIRRLAEAFSNSIVVYHGDLDPNFIKGTIPIKYRLIRHIWPLRVVFFIYSISKKIDIKKINLIHAHTLWGDGLIAYFLYLLYKTPYIVSLRYSDVKIMKYKFWLKPILKKIMLRSAKKVAISATVNTHIKKTLGIEADYIIPNWIEDDFFNKKSLGLDRDIDIIIIGRPVRRKKILESLIFFSKTKLNILVVFGRNSDSNYSKKCKEYIQNTENISFKSNLSKTELISFLDRSKIMWLPSINETMGLVYVEALLRNCSAVGMYNQGLFGLLEHSKLIFQRRNENYKSLLERAFVSFEFNGNVDFTDFEIFQKKYILNKWKELYEECSFE